MTDHHKFLNLLVKDPIADNLCVKVHYGFDDDNDAEVFDVVASNIGDILEELNAVEMAWLVFEDKSYKRYLGNVMILPHEHEDQIGDWTQRLPKPILTILDKVVLGDLYNG